MNDKVRALRTQRGVLVKGAVAVAGVALCVAGCSGTSPQTPTEQPAQGGVAKPAADRTPSAPKILVGQKFRSGGFEVVVNKVHTGLRDYRVGMGMSPATTKNGQLVVAHIQAKNVGMVPAVFGTEHHQMVDTAGRHFRTEEVRGFLYRAEVNPEGAVDGVVIFDVPSTVKLAQLVIQADDRAQGKKASTLVTVPPRPVAKPTPARPRPTATRPAPPAPAKTPAATPAPPKTPAATPAPAQTTPAAPAGTPAATPARSPAAPPARTTPAAPATPAQPRASATPARSG